MSGKAYNSYWSIYAEDTDPIVAVYIVGSKNKVVSPGNGYEAMDHSRTGYRYWVVMSNSAVEMGNDRIAGI